MYEIELNYCGKRLRRVKQANMEGFWYVCCDVTTALNYGIGGCYSALKKANINPELYTKDDKIHNNRYLIRLEAVRLLAIKSIAANAMSLYTYLKSQEPPEVTASVSVVPPAIGLQVTLNDKQEQVVSGRMLWEFLEAKTRYNDWFMRMLDYGFVENVDYILITQKKVTNNPKNPFTEITNHILKLSMAKELCMLARSDKGKQARKYFIQLEKDWNSPIKVMSRAVMYAQSEIKRLEDTCKQQQETISSLEDRAAKFDRMKEMFFKI